LIFLNGSSLIRLLFVSLYYEETEGTLFFIKAISRSFIKVRMKKRKELKGRTLKNEGKDLKSLGLFIAEKFGRIKGRRLKMNRCF
jgi:hypothetical protein